MKYVEDHEDFEKAKEALRSVLCSLRDQEIAALGGKCLGNKKYEISRISYQVGMLEAALEILDLL